MEYTRPTITKIEEQRAEGSCKNGSNASGTRCVAGAAGGLPDCAAGQTAGKGTGCKTGHIP